MQVDVKSFRQIPPEEGQYDYGEYWYSSSTLHSISKAFRHNLYTTVSYKLQYNDRSVACTHTPDSSINYTGITLTGLTVFSPPRLK